MDKDGDVIPIIIEVKDDIPMVFRRVQDAEQYMEGPDVRLGEYVAAIDFDGSFYRILDDGYNQVILVKDAKWQDITALRAALVSLLRGNGQLIEEGLTLDALKRRAERYFER